MIRLLAGLAGALIALVGLTQRPARAHSEPIELEPAAGSIVGGDVVRVRMRVDVPVELGGTHHLIVRDELGERVSLAGDLEISADGLYLTLPIQPLVIPGDYLVEYELESSDGDPPILSSYAFTFDPSAPPPVPVEINVGGLPVLALAAAASAVFLAAIAGIWFRGR